MIEGPAGSMTVLDRDWSYNDLLEWHALTNAIAEARARAERELTRDLEAKRRAATGGR